MILIHFAHLAVFIVISAVLGISSRTRLWCSGENLIFEVFFLLIVSPEGHVDRK